MVLLSIDWTNLHELLRSLYDEMMPLCEDMASVAKGVAGIGALFYVAYRVWQSLSRAEEIDVFPLFRPFVLGLCIMFFPTMVLGTINGILSPVCSATSSLVEQQTFDMKKYQEEKDELEREAMLRDPAKAFLVSDEEFDKKIDELGWSLGDMDTMINMYGQKAVYDMGEKVRQWFRELLELFFQAASLLIFPEGTRTAKGELLNEFQRGAANIAIRANVPIRPVLINCTPSTLTKNEKWYHIPSQPFHIQVKVLDAIQVDDLLEDASVNPKNVRQLNHQLHQFFNQELSKK